MKLFNLLLLLTTTIYSQGSIVIEDTDIYTFKKEKGINKMYLNNLTLKDSAKAVVEEHMIVYINGDLEVGKNCKIEISRSAKVIVVGKTPVQSTNIFKLEEKFKIKDIAILSQYPDDQFIIRKSGFSISGTYNTMLKEKIPDDLYDIWVQGKGYMNDRVLRTLVIKQKK